MAPERHGGLRARQGNAASPDSRRPPVGPARQLTAAPNHCQLVHRGTQVVRMESLGGETTILWRAPRFNWD
jgi:hypothetical protein